MNLFDKHGGYRKLDSFTLASVVQLGTWRFCEAFLNRRNDPGGRHFDQMTQAARSGRANLTEGSERAATSRETEMKLTDVARASLAELKAQGESFRQESGFRERLTAVRLEERDQQQADPDAPLCPECEKSMRKRTAKTGKHAGQSFWGCTAYPECTGTREITP
jgi:four helix bundle protein